MEKNSSNDNSALKTDVLSIGWIDKPIIDDGDAWFALRMAWQHQRPIASWLYNKGIDYFVPMEYRKREKKQGGGLEKQLLPVVRNMLFVRKQENLEETLSQCDYPIYPIKTTDGSAWAAISSKEMFEFRTMCNPELAWREFTDAETARLKKGQRVEVRYGPLKGLSGKLVRQNKHYFLLKEVPGLAVLLKVSRWCCQPV